jgi:hypothetical protein
MRAAAFVALVLAACGGSTPPPEAPSGDTSSLEAKPKDAPEDSASPAASAAPAADPAPAASSEPAAAPAAGAFHQAPSVTGTVDGKSFTPKVAQVVAPMKKDGRVLLTLTEGTDCPAPGAKKDDKKDENTLTLLVPWQDGYKIDLGSLKRSGKKGAGEIAFKSGKKEAAAFKPSGTLTIVSAPMDKGATGKLKIDLQSGDYMLAGDLDIQVCVAPK